MFVLTDYHQTFIDFGQSESNFEKPCEYLRIFRNFEAFTLFSMSYQILRPPYGKVIRPKALISKLEQNILLNERDSIFMVDSHNFNTEAGVLRIESCFMCR